MSSIVKAKRIRMHWGQGLLFLTMVLLSFVMLVPIFLALFNSVKLENQILSSDMSFFPRSIHLDNYQYILDHSAKYGSFFKNSLIVTLSSVLLTLVFCALGGYAFAKLPFRGNKIILGIILFMMTFPLGVLLIPIYIMEYNLKLINTYMGLILPCVSTVVPFCLLIMRSVYLEVPDELEEAATIDGCGVFQTWMRIMIPAARGGLAIVTIITFYSIWGEYLLSKTLVNKESAMTISVGVTLLKGEGGWQFGVLGAVITIAMLPPIIMFMIFQKELVSGLMSGAIKG